MQRAVAQEGCLRHVRQQGDGGQGSVRSAVVHLVQLGLAVAVATSLFVGQLLCQVLLLALEVACGLYSGVGVVRERPLSHSCISRQDLCPGSAPAPPAEARSRLVFWADLTDGDSDDEDDPWRVFSERGGFGADIGGDIGDVPHSLGRDVGTTVAQQQAVAPLRDGPQGVSRDSGQGDQKDVARDGCHEVLLLQARVVQADPPQLARSRAKRKARRVRQLQRKQLACELKHEEQPCHAEPGLEAAVVCEERSCEVGMGSDSEEGDPQQGLGVAVVSAPAESSIGEVIRTLGILQDLIRDARLSESDRQLFEEYLPLAISRAGEGSSHIGLELLGYFVECCG